jgi:hypothetical protein
MINFTCTEQHFLSFFFEISSMQNKIGAVTPTKAFLDFF